MRVEIQISKEIEEPYAVIYAGQMTDEIAAAAAGLEQTRQSVLTVRQEDKFVVLQPSKLYMVRLEDGRVKLYTQDKVYTSKKRLYELEEQLGHDFFRISKTTLINLNYIDSVEPSFQGMMYLKLTNNCRDYISRKYLPGFKKYLGL